MRLLPHALIALMLLTIGAGVAWRTTTARSESKTRLTARESVIQLQQQIHLQAATLPSDGTRRFPESIEPEWFEDGVPRNALLGAGHAWVEVDLEADINQEHPESPIAYDKTHAEFWYNPLNGLIRARVPSGTSEARAVATYNDVNETELDSF